MRFEEVQGPSWWCLETQVADDAVRFRVGRRSKWRRIDFSDIVSAHVEARAHVSWPLGYKLGLDGSEALYAMSGRGVVFRLRTGRSLYLGSRRPEELLRASMTR